MTVTRYTTDIQNGLYWKSDSVIKLEKPDYSRCVCIYPEVIRQKFDGFGGAFTESSGYNFMSLNEEQQNEFVKAYFGKNGLRYSLGRVPLGSCDFSLGNHSAVDKSDGEFDLSYDEKYIFPLLLKAQKERNSSLSLLLSPWSPPAFMKTNKDMNHGGKLLTAFKADWAKIMAEYAARYKANGFKVKYITVQNEPEASQTWDSCRYTAREEGDFAVNELRKALDNAGASEVGILIWDHNKEGLIRRMNESLSVRDAGEAIDGAGVHWYTGDHFEALEIARELYPEKTLYFTEGCVEYSRFKGDNLIQNAEMYAHDIIGNLNAGINGSIDWNLLLDANGGPNHTGNFCDAPIMLDGRGGFEKKGSYWYIGHFSRYILPGARRIGLSRWCAELEATAFLNKDNSIAAAFLNRSNSDLLTNILISDEMFSLNINPHSITTLIIKK